jgi:hypothetical protein
MRGRDLKARRGAALVLALGAACGGSTRSEHAPSQATTSGTFSSGSRLRAHFWDGGGGATAFIDWYDTSLGIPCQFALLDDGSTRCVPPPVRTPVYLDAACSQPAWVASDAPPRIVSTLPANPPCAGQPGPVHLGAVQPKVDAATIYALSILNQCQPGTLGPTDTVYALAPADATAFAAARPAVENRGGGIDVETLTGDDGAGQITGMRDRARGVECAAHALAGGSTADVCVPVTALQLLDNYWSTPDCTGAGGAYACSPGCPAPTLGFTEAVDPGTCARQSAGIFTLGPSASVSYEMQSGACVSVFVNGDVCPFYATGAPVDASAFPALVPGWIGGGPLIAPVETVAGDPRPVSASTSLFDTRARIGCYGTRFADGVGRCVTDDTVRLDASASYYADAACTQRLVVAADSCGSGSTRYVIDPAGATAADAPIQRVYALGTSFDGVQYFRDASTGACEALGPGGAGTLRTLGAEVAPDDVFVRVVERTE